MNDKSSDPLRASRAAAIEQNLFAFISLFGMLGRLEDDNPPGVRRSIVQNNNPLINSIMDYRLAPGDADQAIQVIVADGTARQVPLLWWLGPTSQSTDLGEKLKQHGFVPHDDEPGMTVELEDLNENLPGLDGFSILPARDESSCQQWSTIMQTAFSGKPPQEDRVDAWCDLLRLADPGRLHAFTGFLDGRPVATSLMFLTGEVAGIYAVGTLQEARRKGIGAWMTLHPLLLARSLGYRTGILFASEMGEPVYRSLGFQEQCRIINYLWEPEKQGV